MFLERLEISGFKSFARRTVFSFPNPESKGNGITAVVGPNGSGKSCLLDSIRWVLGEQSIKLLRGKKSEDVIFSGSGKLSAARTADVTLVLNNDLPPPVESAPSAANPEVEHVLKSSSIAVRRVLGRDGTSEYLLNNERARLQDITMLLARIGLGSNTYSLIGQGMIDALLLSTPKDWKEFFDDATGITPYRLKRDATVRKIDATQENLKQAEAVNLEIEPRVRSLARQMKRLERREQFARELADVEMRYYGGALASLTSEYDRATFSCEKYEQDLRTADEQRLKLEQQFEVLTKARGGTKMDALHEQMMTLMRTREKCMTGAAGAENKELRIMNHGVSEANVGELRLALESIAAELEKATSLDGARAMATRLRTLAMQLKADAHEAKLLAPVAVERSLASSELERIDADLAKLEAEMRQLRHQGQEEQNVLLQAQRALTAGNQKRQEIASGLEHARVELARLETRKESLDREIQTDVSEQVRAQVLALVDRNDASAVFSEAQAEELRHDIQRLRHELELIGGIDEEVSKEYGQVHERYIYLETQIHDVTTALESLSQLLRTLERTMESQFSRKFSDIQQTFAQTFSRLFGGGKARIVLVQEEALPVDADTEPTTYNLQPKTSSDHYGITIEAQPPGKKVKSLAMLSGGEKALTAIALVAALIAVAPTPFVVLDEVDAALDEGNSGRLAEVIAELSQKTQFIVITHNRSTMHKAKMLYGITMGEDGASQALSVSFAQAEAMAPADSA